MIVKRIITNLLFVGLLLFLVILKPTYSEAESSLIVTSINNKFNYIKNTSKKVDKAVKKADTALIKRYKDSNIEQSMEDFSNIMRPLSTAAGQKSEKYIFHITRTTTKTVTANIARHTLIVIDKVGTISEVIGSLSTDRKDWVGVSQAVYDSIMSGVFSYAGGSLVTFAIGSNPIGWAVGTVGGVVFYLNTLEPEANKAFDQIAFFHIEDEARENNKINRQRKNEIRNIKKDATKHWQKSCKEWLKEYKNTGKRQDRTIVKKCKKYGIDIYDVCPKDPNKKDPGICGCGKLDIDTDGDRVFDCKDECKNNPKLVRKGKYGENGCQTEDDWRNEQIEAANLKCTKYQFIQWNTNKNVPECVCQGGMKWNEEENECIDEKLVEQDTVKTCKNIKHAEIMPLPGGHYGCDCISPFKWANDSKNKCVCPKPLVLNKAENDCISCKDRYKGSIAADTKTGCKCPKETRWVKDLQQCADQETIAKYCDKKIPGSMPTKKGCKCPKGTKLDKCLHKCIKLSIKVSSEPNPRSIHAVCPRQRPNIQHESNDILYEVKSNTKSSMCLGCTYSDKGVLTGQVHIKNGKMHGIAITYYNDQIKSKTEFRDNVVIGTHTEWIIYKDEGYRWKSLERRYNKKGELHGVETRWSTSRKKIDPNSWHEKFYGGKGKRFTYKKSETKYYRGERVAYTSFYSNGKTEYKGTKIKNGHFLTKHYSFKGKYTGCTEKNSLGEPVVGKCSK